MENFMTGPIFTPKYLKKLMCNCQWKIHIHKFFQFFLNLNWDKMGVFGTKISICYMVDWEQNGLTEV